MLIGYTPIQNKKLIKKTKSCLWHRNYTSIKITLKNSVHTAVFKMDNQQGPTVWPRELLSAMWQPGWKEFWGEWIHVYIWLSPFAIYLKHNIVNQLYSDIKCKIFKKGCAVLDLPNIKMQHTLFYSYVKFKNKIKLKK